VVPLPAELREAFRASGLSHALAASGFHLTVLLGAVMVLARPLGRPGRLRTTAPMRAPARTARCPPCRWPRRPAACKRVHPGRKQLAP
jgi:predicted membrane metal-binding protein